MPNSIFFKNFLKLFVSELVNVTRVKITCRFDRFDKSFVI